MTTTKGRPNRFGGGEKLNTRTQLYAVEYWSIVSSDKVTACKERMGKGRQSGWTKRNGRRVSREDVQTTDQAKTIANPSKEQRNYSQSGIKKEELEN